MSINLLDLVKGSVGGQMGPLAGILGEDETKTSSAVNAALPALIGGLMKKASTPQGADEVFKTLDDHDGGILDNIGGLLGGGNHTGLLNTGTSLLGMLFGNSKPSLLGSIAKMAGIGNGKAGTILGLLAPIVMGFLGKERRSQGLDVGGLTNMLMAQKDHIAPHLKGELSDSLGLGSILGSATGAVKGAGAAASQGVKSAGAAVSDAGRATAGAASGAAADGAKSGGGFLLALLPLILLGALAFWAFNKFSAPKADVAAPSVNVDTPDLSVTTPEVGTPDLSGATPQVGIPDAATFTSGVSTPDLSAAIPSINIPGFENVGSTFGDLTTGLADLTSADGAQGLATKFEEAGSMVDGLNLGALAGTQKEAATQAMGGLVGKLQSAIEVAYKIPGVQAILEPAVNGFLEKFAALGLQ